jgi:hypothetical protein
MRVKLIERRSRVVRHVTLRRVKTRYKVLVGTIEGAPVLSNSKYDSKSDRNDQASPPETTAETGHRDPGAIDEKTSRLLLKEFDESNNWGRLVMQLYFAWFGLQFGINCLGIGWFVTRTEPRPGFRLISLVFVGWNLMGTVGTMMVYKGLSGGQRRMKQLMNTMAKSNQADQPLWLAPRSAMPLKEIGTVFGFCVFTMLISLFYWIVSFLQP